MNKLAFVLSSTVALSIAPCAFAQDQNAQARAQPTGTLGGPGESCRARADCKADLKCVNQVCVDEREGQTCGATSDCGGELKCINHKCSSGTAASSSKSAGGGGAGGDDWMKFNPTDGNLHFFAGLTGAGGFGTTGITGNTPFTGGFNTFNGTAVFALDGGAYIGNHQLSVEIAPVTYVWDAKFAPGPVFEISGNYAYFVPLAESGDIRVFWPLRFGLGMFAGPSNNLGGLAFFEVRADLIGAAIQVGHVVIDLHLPSFRYAITDKNGSQAHMLHWLFGTTIGYVF